MIYSDTSSLASILFKRRHTDEIMGCLERINKKIIIWKFGEVELNCALRSMMRDPEAKLTEYKRQIILNELSFKVNEGQIVIKTNVNADLIMDVAKTISQKPKFTSKSLDTIHVASAKVFSAQYFLSTDVNQRTLAKNEGLKVLPEKMSKKL